MQQSPVAVPDTIGHVEQPELVDLVVVAVVVAVAVDDPHDGPDDHSHGNDAQPHERGERVDEQQISNSQLHIFFFLDTFLGSLSLAKAGLKTHSL